MVAKTQRCDKVVIPAGACRVALEYSHRTRIQTLWYRMAALGYLFPNVTTIASAATFFHARNACGRGERLHNAIPQWQRPLLLPLRPLPHSES